MCFGIAVGQGVPRLDMLSYCLVCRSTEVVPWGMIIARVTRGGCCRE